MQGYSEAEETGHLHGSDAGDSFYEEEYAAKEWAQMLEPLDNKYRLVILLYYMEGFNIREISDILDMKESTVKSRLQRGRNRLQNCMNIRSGRDVPNDES